MPALELKSKTVIVDNNGYLQQFDDWDEEVANELADKAGVGKLDPESIAVLKFIREHYRKYNFFPIISSICKNIHKPKDCVDRKFLNALVAWKIAGLPHPEEPIISLLEAGQSPG